MLTQKELAKRIGVSQQAVSFALNGGGTLKQATREHIIEEARKAGYRVNGASRLFREGRTNSIALIVQGNFHTLPRLMLSALRLALREKEMHLTLYGAEKEDFADPQNPPRLVREKTVDGFLVLYDGRGTTLSEQIAQYRIPSVWINQKQAENAVYPDDYGNTRRLVRELAARRAGHLLYFGTAPYPDSHYSVADRRRGFEDGLKDTGRSGEVYETPDIEAGADLRHASVRSILQRKRKRPRVVIAYSVEDAEAFTIQAALLGVKIPDDLMVCCFVRQGESIAHYPMTRTLIPMHTCGTKALEMLIQRIASPKQNFPSIAVDDFILHEEPTPEGFYGCDP